MLKLALQSLWNRRYVAVITVLSIALSVALILGVERLRTEARESFANSASGLDVIVAARGNPVQILMSTVFGVGSTGAALSWESFEMVEELAAVAWAVPISMGDNHRGYPVIGTEKAYFDHFRHSGGQALDFARGAPFDDRDGAVIGAEVATRFGYALGDIIVNAHGAGSVAFDVHDEAPFTITGVLAPTGTAVDRMVFVSLEGFDALHAEPEAPPADPFAETMSPSGTKTGTVHDDDHEQHADHAHAGEHDREPDHASTEDHDVPDAHENDELHADHEADADHAHEEEHLHEPDRINAIYVGLSERTAVLGIQRAIAEYPGEPLTAVLPNVALLELWSITGTAERALRLMAWAVAVAGILGLVAMLSATLDARRREFAILRSVGATPARIFGLILTEAAVLTLAGILLGFAFGVLAMTLAEPQIAARFGIRFGVGLPSPRELGLVAGIFCAGLLASLVPAYRVYKMTLADGLTIRL